MNAAAIPAELRARQQCACGCGASLPIPKYPSEQRRFIHGHHARVQTGALHSQWNGGRYVNHRGHVMRRVPPDHPYAAMRRSDGYVPEHRLVMAEHLGRPLRREEVVHHKLPCEGGSGDRTDNRLSNLTLFSTQSAHMAHHAAIDKGKGIW